MNDQLPDNPIYVTGDVEEAAQAKKQQLLDIGCCEDYAEAGRVEFLKHAVRVGSSYEANVIQTGRTLAS